MLSKYPIIRVQHSLCSGCNSYFLTFQTALQYFSITDISVVLTMCTYLCGQCEYAIGLCLIGHVR